MTDELDPSIPNRATRAGEYDLIRRIGAGGFGVVFEAKHRDSGRPYAVKRIDMSVEDAERHRNEAVRHATIASQSLHVMGVHSFFHDSAEDVFYLVTELIPDGDLRQFLDSNPKPLPLADGLAMSIGIAKGLAAIHAQGIVHRDLKPTNVLMDRKDDVWVPKITDFGLAQSSRSVSIGDFASSGYAAPEQVDLLSDQPLGFESDLFSFGMMLYELMTGDKPSPAQDLREYGRWLGKRQPPPAPSLVRPELALWPQIDTLLASLLEFERTRRLQSAPEALRTLTEVLRQVERGTRAEQPAETVESEKTASHPDPRPRVDATGPWTRWRVMLVMIAVFAATGSAMTFGLPSRSAEKFAPSIPPLLVDYKKAPSLVDLASWAVLPALFGLTLGLAVRLNLSRAAIVSLLSVVVYEGGVILVWLAIAIMASDSSRTTSWTISLLAMVLPAIAMLASIGPWRRPRRRVVFISASAGIVGVVGAWAVMAWNPRLGFDASWALMSAWWQVLVGVTIVDRTLFSGTKSLQDWPWKPVVSVGCIALVLSGAGTWARSLPVPPKAGTKEENPNDHRKYVWTPPGDFKMGCSADDGECGQDEQPAHDVTFTKGFWMSEFEVTVGDWKKGPRGAQLPPPAEWGGLTYNPGWAGESMPIMYVTWLEARDYCSSIDGRLPTEAEWEYAARAGSTGPRFGRLKEMARYADNSGENPLNTTLMSDEALHTAVIANRNTMHDVASLYRGNAWAMADMLGNISEWVQDDYGERTYEIATRALTDPPAHLTGVSGAEKVVRGGSWASRPQDVRSSARGRQAPDTRSVFVGFRCVWKGPKGQ